jgi:hypothetical protein
MKKNLIIFASGFLLCSLLIHSCEDRKPIEKIKTKIRVVKVTDTLRVDGKVTTKYKDVFIRKTDTSIVYVEKEDDQSIQARFYEQKISGNRFKGVANITTTGELLDFSSVIEIQDSIKETTITKYKDRSRMFVSPSYNTNNQINLSLDWNIKNKMLIKGGVGYDINNSVPYLSVGLGIPIF